MRANIAEKSKCCSASQHSVEKMMVASHEVNAQFTPRKPDFTPIVRQNWRLGNCSNAASACRARERLRENTSQFRLRDLPTLKRIPYGFGNRGPTLRRTPAFQ